jgi:hypothetical protein
MLLKRPMNTFAKFAAAALAAVIVLLVSSGCATVLHRGPRSISIDSQPRGARVTVSTEEGQVVTVNHTPCTVQLSTNNRFFHGQAYVIKLELDGYKNAEVALKPSVSGWYLGDLLVGDLIGLLIVDPSTGAMWNLRPEKIERSLTPSQAALVRQRDGFLVMLSAEATPGERAEMVRVK